MASLLSLQIIIVLGLWFYHTLIIIFVNYFVTTSTSYINFKNYYNVQVCRRTVIFREL